MSRKREALFGVPCGRGFAAWGDGDAENTRVHTISFFPSLGRSMIEMLGVLAIIGVLSAGGIMGYSAAMENYKVNKTIEDVQNMAMSATSFFTKYPNNTTSQYVNNTGLCQIGVIPKEYCQTCTVPTGCSRLTGKLGTMSIHVGMNKSNSNVYTLRNGRTIRRDMSAWLAVGFGKITQNQCVKIMIHDWGSKNASVWTQNVGESRFELPLSMENAKTTCEGLFSNDKEVIMWFSLQGVRVQ